VRQFLAKFLVRDGDIWWVARTDNASPAKRLRRHHGVTTRPGMPLAKS
jgi:hypothetical protein